jgi:uncharacterized membrane protein
LKQKELSVWLKAVLVLLAASCLVLAFLIVPEQADELVTAHPEYRDCFLPCLIFVEATFLPVFAALILAWQIFSDIGRDSSFSAKNALRLRSMSRLALLDTVFYVIGAVVLLAQDLLNFDILFVIICIVFMGFCFTVACAALSHLTKKAAEMKSENDLTI